MNGMSRFLSKRKPKGSGASDGKHHLHKDSYRIFHPEERKKGDKADKEEEKKVKALLKRLEELSITDLKDTNIEYALRSPSVAGNSDKAFDLLMLYRDAVHGELREVKPDVKMVGAINRENVTCYLDSLLFAMFGRVNSFEVILADTNPIDAGKRELATVLRLWVNMLRTGKLITTDITQRLQETLKDCGWPEAAHLRQQDVSEAFTFITGKLNLPLLTLKMDVYHTGKEDKDDHRIVRERLLEVGIPAPHADGSDVKLEECLEAYFNNQIEVKRHLQRRNTVQSFRPGSLEKGKAVHVETVELPPSPSSLSGSNPLAVQRRLVNTRLRADSIFSRRGITAGDTSEPNKKTHDDIGLGGRPRAETIRNEVHMAAWQFFRMIPWNTTPEAPETDAQVAQHLQTKKPMLGICLKRYSMTNEGVGSRLNTYIDIPLEIGLPHFIDDSVPGEGFAANFTNFKLSLQSVICHRGKSLDAGHYISLVRNQIPNSGVQPPETPWLRFDDLAKERIAPVKIEEALKEECPYLLFYQVQPIDDIEDERGNPPTYDEAMVPSRTDLTTVVTKSSNADTDTTATTATTDSSSSRPTPSRLPSMLDVGIPSATKSLPSMLDVDQPPAERADSADTIHPLEPIGPPIPNILTKAPTLPSIEPTSPLPPMPTTLRPKSINLADLSAQQRSSLELPRGRTSFQSNERRSSIAFTDNVTDNESSYKGGSSAPITPGDEAEARSSYLSSGIGTSRRNSIAKSWARKAKSRPTSQSGENRLSMGSTLGKLKNAMSKDKLSGGVSVEEVTNSPAGTGKKEKDKEKGADVRRSKSMRLVRDKDRDKRRSSSVGRQLKEALAASGDKEVGGKKPDRECVVM